MKQFMKDMCSVALIVAATASTAALIGYMGIREAEAIQLEGEWDTALHQCIMDYRSFCNIKLASNKPYQTCVMALSGKGMFQC